MMAEQDDDLFRTEYERCHPDDAFNALSRRAVFTKEDGLLLEGWCATVRARRTASVRPAPGPGEHRADTPRPGRDCAAGTHLQPLHA